MLSRAMMRALRAAPPQRLLALGAIETQPVGADFGVGKWSRVMTFGEKKQRQVDGKLKDFSFTPETFGQVLRNFKTRFSQRRLGSDWEHQALNAPLNGRPAPNLCFWDAFAVIEGDAVTGVEEQQPGPAPDPAELRAWLAKEFPAADPDPSGLWSRCCEVTDHGRVLIPQYRQLSPLFDDEALGEDGKPIGYCIGNISFVNFAFQDGTLFHFSNLPSSQQHQPGVGGPMNEQEMMSRLKLTGTEPPEKKAEALANYLAETDDPKEMRGAMKACMAAHMSKMADPPPPPADDKKNPTAPSAALSDAPPPPPKKEEEGKESAAMSAILQKQLAAMGARLDTTESKLRSAEQKEAELVKKTAATAFAGTAIREGRFSDDCRDELVALHMASPEQATAFAAKQRAGRFSPSRLFPGGNPAGMSATQARGSAGGPWAMAGSTPVRGLGLSGLADKIAREKKIPYDEALLEAQRENPTLY